MKILQPILIQVQRLEVARVPHHDVFQFHHPIARDVEVGEVGKAAEGLRLDFCQLVVLQYKKRSGIKVTFLGIFGLSQLFCNSNTRRARSLLTTPAPPWLFSNDCSSR